MDENALIPTPFETVVRHLLATAFNRHQELAKDPEPVVDEEGLAAAREDMLIADEVDRQIELKLYGIGV